MSTQFGLKRALKAAGTLAVGALVCAGLLGSGLQAQAGAPSNILAGQERAGKIDASVTRDLAGDDSASIVILLKDQANLTAAYGMKDQDARGWYVYNTLRQHAERTQAPLKDMLISEGVQVKSYWAANMIAAESANADLVQRLAAREDVRVIESNAPQRWIDPLSPGEPMTPSAIEWGVQNVNAPQVWALGYTGTGMVVGNQDTGVRWTHNAIKPKYRGWNGTSADHNYNWWDAIHSGGGTCGPNTQQPCDDHSHGTHTTGTTVGDDGAGNQIGVAPGARWIGCRNMNVGVGTPGTYTECFEFFIAPTDLAGGNADPTKRPHVMNNSWGCPPSEGCSANSLQQIVENTQAAGIFVVASAGNSGSSCSTVQDPPAIYAASYSVGAINSSNALAGFSSRGPVTIDSSNRLKPDISAPGVNVRSATNASDTSYSSFQGTSMAGPHVVGVVALLWDAKPSLERAITETKTLLNMTANPQVTASGICGGTGQGDIPNNLFGYGRVDALAAVQAGGGTPTPTSVASSTPTPPGPTPTGCAVTNVIVDGSFEGGSPNAAWDEGSTNFGTPLCDEATCGNGGGTAGPRTGAWWSWFGGIAAVEDAFVSQSVNIPAGSQATLQFYIWLGAHSGAGTADYMRVTVGGTEVFRVTDANTEYDAGYTLVTVDVSAQAGGSREVRFESHNGAVDVFNLSLDDVTLNVGSCPTPVPPTATPIPPTATATSVPPTNTAVVTATETPGTPVATNTPGTPVATPTACTLNFADVPADHTFYPFVRCLACQGIISGYECGGDFEPCNTNNDPYFRPNNHVTRGQLSKVVSQSAGFNEVVPPTQQSFEDVPYGSTFWEFVERLYTRGVIGGYECGVDPNEPCIPPADRPYFRPDSGATRGQLTKIVSQSAGFTDVIPPTQQTFTDVPTDNTFWVFVERLLLNRPDVMSGYPCDLLPSEPCDAENRPYFRPNNPLTRGQTSKIVANTFFPDCNIPRP